MNYLKQSLIPLLFIAFLAPCHSQTDRDAAVVPAEGKRQVLLIGTFHYHNPGADVAKTRAFDVLNEASQQQLEAVAEKIKTFKPGHFFVEWPYDEQDKLDSLYSLYKAGSYFNNDSLSAFYQKNEIFQLAFRAAKESKLGAVHAIDYRDTQFPFDSLMQVIASHRQTALQKEIENGIKYFTSEFDSMIENGASLLELTYYLNSDDMRVRSNKFHTEIPLLAGEKDNFIGPYLASEWHRRNLYMWSLAQKSAGTGNGKIVLLLGASHIAMIKEYIDANEQWEAVELKDIME